MSHLPPFEPPFNRHEEAFHAMIKNAEIRDFQRESNRIEGITRNPTPDEVQALTAFLQLEKITIGDLEEYVGVVQPQARLRAFPGLDVRVGNHIAPAGGPDIVVALQSLLREIDIGVQPFHVHQAYETLHPFTDGNGRSGRAIWAWQMMRLQGHLRLGFLHQFYYQALENWREY